MKKSYRRWIAGVLAASMVLGMGAPAVSYAQIGRASCRERV